MAKSDCGPGGAATGTAYQQITDRIITMLEQGVRPWAQGWKTGGGRPLRHNGEPYRGINTLNLWAAAEARGFVSPYWMTYKTAESLGAQVMRGAKAERAFYVGTSSREVEQEDGSTSEDRFRFMKSYSVFNAAEIDGLDLRFYAPGVAVPLAEDERHPQAEAWIAGTGTAISHHGERAFYNTKWDYIHVPEFRLFTSGAAYYTVVFHELAHWTGAPKRLDRQKGEAFGTPEYALEELVAELAAAFLCADLGICSEVREDHAAYISDWLNGLKGDQRFIFKAAAAAEKAAGFLHALQPAQQAEAA